MLMAIKNPQTGQTETHDLTGQDINEVLNGNEEASGRNKQVFGLEDFKLKLVFQNFDDDFESYAEVNGLADTWLISQEFTQDGLTGKTGNVVGQYASDGNFAYGIEEHGWREMLTKTVQMQENIIQQTKEEDGSAALCYDLRPANIHLYEEDDTYQTKVIDVADRNSIKEVDNSYQLSSRLSEAYAFMIEGKQDDRGGQKGLIDYADEMGVDIGKGEAVSVLAEASEYITGDIEYQDGENLARDYELNIN